MKGLAVEEHHPEEAIKYYDQILNYEDKLSKEKPKQKKLFANVLQHKGLALKKLGKPEDAQKCITTAFTISNAVFLSSTLFTMTELEKKDKQFALIWNKIIKNIGKLMKTKKGNVFSYKISKNKENIIIILHFQNSPTYPIASGNYSYINKNLIRNAFDVYPTKSPTELKKLLNLQTLSDTTHLWGIFNDPEILNK